MSRPISVSLFSLLLIALFFGMSGIYQSCSKKDNTGDLSTEEKAVQVAETYTKENYFEDDEGTGEEGNLTTTESSQPPSSEAAIKESSTVSTSKPASPGRQAASSRTNDRSASTSGNPYSIVAGNYLVESNAEAMKDRLIKEGYSGAEVAVFDLSQYYTVLAGRFESYSYAKSVSGELKSIGIDNYILTKK